MHFAGAEVRLDVPADGGSRFTVDADDPYRPVLTVEPDPTRPLPARWQRPATPPAPSATGMSWVEDPAAELTGADVTLRSDLNFNAALGWNGPSTVP